MKPFFPTPFLQTSCSAVHVAVGVILNPQRQVLVSLRHRDSHQGGLWEFPGGKLEAGESVSAALRRELEEELGIAIGAHHPIKKILHRYKDKTVLLDVWLVREFNGEPTPREAQELRWCGLEDLDRLEFPAANASIIDCLQLPPQIAITPDVSSNAELESLLESYVRQEIHLIQLRQTQLDSNQLLNMTRFALNYLASESSQKQIRVMLDGSPESQQRLTEAGLHLNPTRLMQLQARPGSVTDLLSASCHNVDQLKQAEKIAVDFAFLSPVRSSGSHPGAEVLGWQQFQQMADSVSIPVYAVGGLGPDYLNQAFSCGAHGIAGISAYADKLSI